MEPSRKRRGFIERGEGVGKATAVVAVSCLSLGVTAASGRIDFAGAGRQAGQPNAGPYAGARDDHGARGGANGGSEGGVRGGGSGGSGGSGGGGSRGGGSGSGSGPGSEGGSRGSGGSGGAGGSGGGDPSSGSGRSSGGSGGSGGSTGPGQADQGGKAVQGGDQGAGTGGEARGRSNGGADGRGVGDTQVGHGRCGATCPGVQVPRTPGTPTFTVVAPAAVAIALRTPAPTSVSVSPTFSSTASPAKGSRRRVTGPPASPSGGAGLGLGGGSRAVATGTLAALTGSLPSSSPATLADRFHHTGGKAAPAPTPAPSRPNVIQRIERVIPGFVWLALAAALAVAGVAAGSALWSRRRIRRQAQQFAVISAAALTDPLTGVLNRRGFAEAVDRELARARRYERPFLLAYVDVRGLKAVNDTEGHRAGDELLRQAAHLLTEAARADDVVGRLGGDELGLLLVEQGPEASVAVGRRIEAKVLDRRAAMGLRSYWDLTIGTAAFPHDGESFDELLRTADLRLYEQRGIALR